MLELMVGILGSVAVPVLAVWVYRLSAGIRKSGFSRPGLLRQGKQVGPGHNNRDKPGSPRQEKPKRINNHIKTGDIKTPWGW